MASNFFQNIQKSVQGFIYTVTTNDHYASYDSTGRHGSVEHQQSSSGEIPYHDSANDSTTGLTMMDNTSATSLPSARSSTSVAPVQYRPGLRSQLQNNASGDVQLQEYINGRPPMPSMSTIWERLDAWLEREFPELGDDLEGPASANDLNEVENDLGLSLPLDVRESYQVHDGQMRTGKNRGLVYGMPLLNLEEVVEEVKIWRKVAERVEQEESQQQQKKFTLQENSSSSSLNRKKNARTKSGFLVRQKSVPAGCIKETYAHKNWVPLIKDFVGNNIAIDMAPGPQGRWGQVILFGRDFDTKYVVANSWTEFLLNLVEDLEDGKVNIDSEDEEMTFVENNRSVNYFDVLIHRTVAPLRAAAKRKGKQPASGPYRNPGATSDSRVSLPRETIISPATSSPNLAKKANPHALSKETVAASDVVLEDDDHPEVEAKDEPVVTQIERAAPVKKTQAEKPAEETKTEKPVDEAKAEVPVEEADKKEEAVESPAEEDEETGEKTEATAEATTEESTAETATEETAEEPETAVQGAEAKEDEI